MKIDVTKIPNFETLPDDVKTAITGMDIIPDMSGYVEKAVFDRKASEASSLSKQLREKMTEDEQKTSEKSVQDLTDKYIKEIDGITAKKEKEIMQI